ncbi:hypothetical protein IMY05_C4420000500 [Salix suchowensis]|nr:hypothetical protein IMY05_C4420000500 [Salix suchowensis]
MDALYYHLSPTATHLTHQPTFGGFDTACTLSAWVLCMIFVLGIWFLALPTQLRRTRQRRDTTSMTSLVSDGVPDNYTDSMITLSSSKTTIGAVGEDLSEHAATSPYPRDPSCSTKPSPYAFTSLCDRLVLTNTVWEQQKELKTLRSANWTKEQAHARSTFAAFTDRLLLQNRIWQQERQISELRASCERLKKAQESMITRTAEKMMVDVRKEGLVEDFVMDLIAELEASKKEILSVRESYEREITEINCEWMKDYRRLVHRPAQSRDPRGEGPGLRDAGSNFFECVASPRWTLCLFPSHSLSFTNIDVVTPARRMSAEFDDDDTLADFSIASTSTLAKYNMSQASPTGLDFLCQRCAHSHGVRSSSHLCPPKGRYGYDASSPNAVSNSIPLPPLQFPASRARAITTKFSSLPFDRQYHFVYRLAERRPGRRPPKRPTLMPLKLSMWSHRRKDHRSPTSASRGRH